MKRRHQYPLKVSMNMEGKISPEYQAEVDASTERLAQQYQREQKALESAERRLERALERRERAEKRADKVRAQKEIRRLDELVEQRRQELLKLQRLMTEVPAPSKNRGSGQVRHVSGADQIRAVVPSD